MAKNSILLMTVLCCMGLVALVPACSRDKSGKTRYRKEDKTYSNKRVKKEKTVKKDSGRPTGVRTETKTVKEVSSNY